MPNRETFPSERKNWQSTVEALVDACAEETVPLEISIPIMLALCVELLRDSELQDWGELQRFLRAGEKSVQLVAKPVIKDDLSQAASTCIHPIDQQPRGHWLLVLVGHGQINEHFQNNPVSHEVNEAALANDTGLSSTTYHMYYGS